MVWDAKFEKLYSAQTGMTFHVRHQVLNTHFCVPIVRRMVLPDKESVCPPNRCGTGGGIPISHGTTIKSVRPTSLVKQSRKISIKRARGTLPIRPEHNYTMLFLHWLCMASSSASFVLPLRREELAHEEPLGYLKSNRSDTPGLGNPSSDWDNSGAATPASRVLPLISVSTRAKQSILR